MCQVAYFEGENFRGLEQIRKTMPICSPQKIPTIQYCTLPLYLVLHNH